VQVLALLLVQIPTLCSNTGGGICAGAGASTWHLKLVLALVLVLVPGIWTLKLVLALVLTLMLGPDAWLLLVCVLRSGC